jgi:RNA-dependent RNA polymerase
VFLCEVRLFIRKLNLLSEVDFQSGDIRVVKAVDCDDLLHLVGRQLFVPLTRMQHDVVVLPANGDRDLARYIKIPARLLVSQCSGGDLDGDDYTVIWAPVLSLH